MHVGWNGVKLLFVIVCFVLQLKLNDEGFLEYHIKTPNDEEVTNILSNRKNYDYCFQ